VEKPEASQDDSATFQGHQHPTCGRPREPPSHLRSPSAAYNEAAFSEASVSEAGIYTGITPTPAAYCTAAAGTRNSCRGAGRETGFAVAAALTRAV
jgi:hypothetical protein